MFRTFRAALCAALLPWAATADPAVLILANAQYDEGLNAPNAARFTGLAEAWRDAGADVTLGSEVERREATRLLNRFGRALARTERGDVALVVLAGRFVQLGRESYFLPTDAPARPTAAELLDVGIPVSLIGGMLTEAREAGARPLLILAQPRERRILGDRELAEPGLGAAEGTGVPTIAGVDTAVFRQAGALRVPSANFDPSTVNSPDLDVAGFDLAAAPAPAPAPVTPRPGRADRAERDYWTTVERFDSRTAYEAYLNRYPRGVYAATARQRLAAIDADPTRDARLAEDRLDLDREERRAIQSDLVLLGYNTRGVDGIFGPGTRGAIRAWQDAEGLPGTGFVDAAQVAQLDAQGARRQAQLDAEAERRRAETERADRAFWDETGRGATERGVLTYLERFPDGLYADTAELRLSAFEAESRAAAEARDSRAWDAAQSAGTPAAYQLYLQEQPNGAFRDQAQAALARVAQRNDRREQFLAEEQALGLTGEWRRLVEVGLERQGLEPGEVDGRFDRQTRRALRRYQNSRGLERTGFLNQETVVRMLQEAIIR